jgi:RecA-family ATPase
VSAAEHLPHSVEAEQAVLGGLILDNGSWSAVADLTIDAFFRRDHRMIFGALAELFSTGRPADLVTVSAELQRRGQLTESGGDAYLATLLRDTPTAANIRAYADLIVERSTRRVAIEQARAVVRAARDLSVPIESEPKNKRTAIDWASLENQTPSPRQWIVPSWIPAGHVTLLAGRPGIGKTLLAQHLGSAIALGHEYIEELAPRRVLIWAAEDDSDELWRRQLAINSYLQTPLSALADRLFMHSYVGADVTLMAPVFGKLDTTRALEDLRQQVGDYRAEVVFLDNTARLFGGNENDRPAVTRFCTTVQGKCAPAGVVLLGHPAKQALSEFSGSSAWEAAVRSRLYLSDRPPDQEAGEDEPPVNDRERYLARRKANYSPRELRRFSMIDGVLIPDAAEPLKARTPVSGDFAKDIVRRAIRALAERELYGSASTSSQNYLPRMAREYQVLDRLTEKQFGKVMRELILAGEIGSEKVGRYENRTQKFGLVLK